ncbi:hypothetical protein E4L95_05545 [Paracoccus liaowanqingii]|uniref:Uncharacterized protein n=1 Tax=Paracoccus liaowanqingii TaxID=2560053 RepID=A0A4Z1CQE5_9RHOB|nr:hypothetical protein [Paracoccus liaowanqingii]TGN67254.1 hypothetical protein E4L95_05545 [Paracoccus liaowanqingii]
MTVFELRSCVARQWSPQIGDPELTGWVTVLAYAVAALLSGLVWRRLAGDPLRIFWGVLVVLLAFLAVNKQLDLQTVLTEAGKCLSRAQGWYDDRRVVQVAFIGTLLIVLLMAMGVLMAVLRGRIAQNALALAGLILVLGFVMVRAVSIHNFDQILGGASLGVSNNFLLENAGLVLIALNALWLLRRPQGRLRPR